MYKISYVADGNTNQFAFTFPFFQNADVCVSINDEMQNTASFTVNPNADMNGGNVVLSDVPAQNSRVDIFRHVSLSRIIDYQPTMKIDPENLNADFNFLLAVCQDVYENHIDAGEWKNAHDNIRAAIDYTLSVISDKMGGGSVLGLYNNLLHVLDNALPNLINDYGYITESAPNENRDDYGIL